MSTRGRTATPPHTLIQAMVAAWEALARPGDGVVPPVAVLWTDHAGEWNKLWPTVLDAGFPALRLGAYDLASRTGPAIWIRAVLAGALPDIAPGQCSVVYLPGIERNQLRAGPGCPPDVQPLVELLYRGTGWWHRTNYDDWTVGGYLGSGVDYGGLGLDMPRDHATRQAAAGAVVKLATVPLDRLRGRTLRASDFDSLHLPDPVLTLLAWLERGDVVRAGMGADAWESLRSLARDQFGVDPEVDDAQAVVRKMTDPSGQLDPVWQRLAAIPHQYPGVVARLRALGGTIPDLFAEEARFPATNDAGELAVRAALGALPGHAPSEARAAVRTLEAEHGRRRSWTWAVIGEARMAQALEPLSRLAHATATGPGATDIPGIAQWYEHTGHQADRAALDALRLATGSNTTLIREAVGKLYLPWLEQVATKFQSAVGPNPSLTLAPTGTTPPADGECIVFVDGLRFDVAAWLGTELRAGDVDVTLSHRLAPFPSVTGTAKPFAAGAQASIDRASGSTSSFEPRLLGSGQPASSDKLRTLLQLGGVTILPACEAPVTDDARGWIEVGTIDKRGHDGGLDMVVHLDEEIALATRTVIALLDAGWKQVRVVTDHGWLLVPGNLPYQPLPRVVAPDQWARAALPDDGAMPDVPLRPWHWNPMVQVASPAGVGSFRPNVAYAHGGLTPQECVVPELLVRRGTVTNPVTVRSVTWNRMSCRVDVETGGQTVRVALRLSWRDEASTIAVAPQPVGVSGSCRVAVSDDHEGKAITVVVLDPTGNVLARAATTVGGA